MKRQFLIILTVIIGLLVTSSVFAGDGEESTAGSDDREEPTVSESKKQVRKTVDGSTSLGISLMKILIEQEGGWQQKNIALSPWSITSCLAMIRTGAAGKTRKAISKTLGLNQMTDKDIRNGFVNLRKSLTEAGRGVNLNDASSAWVHDKFHFRASFLERVKKTFSVESRRISFNGRPAADRVNNWVKKNTSGMIKKMFDTLSFARGDVAALVNAVYFNGNWKLEFDAKKTKKANFHLPGNEKKEIPLMCQKSRTYRKNGNLKEVKYKYHYTNREHFRMIRLPYGEEGRFAMTVFLPDRDRDLGQFLSRLSVKNLNTWLTKLTESRKEKLDLIKLPRFQVSYGPEKPIQLNEPLKKLGMGIAFSRKKADFTSMIRGETGRKVAISRVIHRTRLKVTEKGTEAAAATAARASGGIPKKTKFVADRPFFYVIRDQETRLPLFWGTVVDPEPVR